MNRAIGSVLPLPMRADRPSGSVWARWTAGHRHAAAYGSARSALAALLAFRRIERLWLPAYACTALADAAAACMVAWYGVDATLDADIGALEAGLRPGDAVLAIDYFGRPSGPALQAFAAARSDILWIQDRAQALEPGAIWGDVALYSPRKLLGVGDGGLLVSDAPLPTPSHPAGAHTANAQMARAADPDGHRPDLWFPAFQAQEVAFRVDDTAMTAATRTLLQHVELAPLAAARRANAAILTAALPDLALWPDAFTPLAVPIRIADRDAVAASLATAGIYCARHWPHLPSDPAAFPLAHTLSGELLSLPCDHRYGAADMARIVAALRAAHARPAAITASPLSLGMPYASPSQLHGP